MTGNRSITRDALYTMVWAKPLSKVAMELGVSDVAIAKICRKLDIPRPPRGYWARKAHGYPVAKPELPKAKPDTPESYLLRPQESKRAPRSEGGAPKPLVEVKDKVFRYHPIVASRRSMLVGGWTDQYGRIRSDTGLNVSKNALPQTCRILNALVTALESHGITVVLDGDKLACDIEGETIRFEVHEPSKRTEVPSRDSRYTRHEYEPTGRLSLKLWSHYLANYQTQWADGKKQRLEDLLGDVVHTLLQAPDIISERKDEEHRQQLRRERKRLVERRKSDRYRLTRERANAIDTLICSLEKAKDVRRFVSAVDAEDSVPATTRRLARWASKYADHLDSLVDFELDKLGEEPEQRPWYLRD